jgi:hypothetical protein
MRLKLKYKTKKKNVQLQEKQVKTLSIELNMLVRAKKSKQQNVREQLLGSTFSCGNFKKKLCMSFDAQKHLKKLRIFLLYLFLTSSSMNQKKMAI